MKGTDMKLFQYAFKGFFLLALCINLHAQSTGSWTRNNVQVELANGKISISQNQKHLTTISSINFNFTQPKSITIAKQSSDTLSVLLAYPLTASYRDVTTDVLATIDITVENGIIRFHSKPGWASNVTIQLQDNGEQYFGVLEPLFPNNQRSPNLRGNVVSVDVTGDASWYHENYASVWSAFYMTNNGYASFFDSFAAGVYTLGINGVTELYHRTGNLDWYLITGTNGDAIMQRYYSIIGKPKFVPMWACGPVAWRDENKGGANEILDDIQQMTNLKIPFTAWFVDRPYSNGAEAWSKMDFNDKFANPKEWINTIRSKYNLRFMTWVAPATFADKDFPGLFPSQEGYIDLTNPDGVKEFGKRLKENQYSIGVQGHKLDRADQLFPQMYPWHDRTPIAERRNKYLYLYAKVTDSLLRDSFQDDQVNFARASFHRSQPYLSALWGGDSRSSWDGLAGNIANAMRCGFMGFPVWGSDVGGYLGGRIAEDLYARWLEFGVWSALYEIKLDDAGGVHKDRVPWRYSERLQTIFRNCNELRMQLQPYIFSLANTSYKNGVAMKPLAYAFSDDKKTYDVWNEYLLGNTFLVAPILDTTGTRTVYLPHGTWYDYNDLNKTYEGGKEITVTVPLEQIPVFVRANSLYVTGMLADGNTKLWSTNKPHLNIHAFAGNDTETASFDYVDALDGNKEKTITITNNGNELQISVPSLTIASSVLIKLEKKPSSATLNGTQTKIAWNKKISVASIELEKGSAANIVITR
jgi:alpha-glucosidase (family GH31 glycosyl hydrolase)